MALTCSWERLLGEESVLKSCTTKNGSGNG